MATWKQFREAMWKVAGFSRERRGQFLFRGHRTASWPLESTLDRFRSFTDDPTRSRFVGSLLDEFLREAVGVRDVRSPVSKDEAFELIARHHGLPSPLLDWSQSPYVAAYFAFQDAAGPEPVCIWVLDRAKLPVTPTGLTDFDIVDDRMLLQYNRRALQQQSVFLRVNTVREPLEKLLGPAVAKVELQVADRPQVLADLDAMNITGTTLFDDLDGVARTVRARLQ